MQHMVVETRGKIVEEVRHIVNRRHRVCRSSQRRQQVFRRRMLWIGLECLAKTGDGAVTIAKVPKNCTEIMVCFGKFGVDCEGCAVAVGGGGKVAAVSVSYSEIEMVA